MMAEDSDSDSNSNSSEEPLDKKLVFWNQGYWAIKDDIKEAVARLRKECGAIEGFDEWLIEIFGELAR